MRRLIVVRLFLVLLGVGLLPLGISRAAALQRGSEARASVQAAAPEAPAAADAVQSGGTGLPEVDALLDAVLRQDAAALTAMLGYSEVECLAERPEVVDYTAPLTCEQAGVPAGTRLRYLPFSSCHGEWRGEGEVGFRLSEDNALYGVYRYTPDTYPYRDDGQLAGPTPDYAVFIEETEARARYEYPIGSVYYLSAGKIVRLSLFGACGPPTPAADDPGWIIPPR